MRLLLHACCAPCANRPIESLRQEGMAVTGFWFNPNIHPYTEYQARKSTLEAGPMTCGPGSSMWRTTLRAGAPIAIRSAWRRPPAMPPKTGMRALPPRCSSPPTKSTMPSGPLPSLWEKNMGSPSSIGTFDLCSGRARNLRGSTGCTCRNTAAVFSARRTATWPPSEKRRPPGRRWKDSRGKIDGTGTGSKRGVSPFCVLKSFPQGVEKREGKGKKFSTGGGLFRGGGGNTPVCPSGGPVHGL